MFTKSVDTITKNFVKMVGDLDKLILNKQKDITLCEEVQAEAQKQIDLNKVEVVRAEKIKVNIEKLLDI